MSNGSSQYSAIRPWIELGSQFTSLLQQPRLCSTDHGGGLGRTTQEWSIRNKCTLISDKLFLCSTTMAYSIYDIYEKSIFLFGFKRKTPQLIWIKLMGTSGQKNTITSRSKVPFISWTFGHYNNKISGVVNGGASLCVQSMWPLTSFWTCVLSNYNWAHSLKKNESFRPELLFLVFSKIKLPTNLKQYLLLSLWDAACTLIYCRYATSSMLV